MCNIHVGVSKTSNIYAGNECFKQQKYPEAVKHYTESLRRNPNDPKVRSLILFL